MLTTGEDTVKSKALRRDPRIRPVRVLALLGVAD
jgi:hypothetical protein